MLEVTEIMELDKMVESLVQYLRCMVVQRHYTLYGVLLSNFSLFFDPFSFFCQYR